MPGLRERLWNDPPGWLAPLAIVATLAACLALGRVPPLPPPALAAVTAALALGVVAVALVVPPLGLIALIGGALASPVAFATGTHTTVHFAIVAVPVVAAGAALHGLRRGGAGLWRGAAVQAACALGAIAVLAAAVANVPGWGPASRAPARAQLGGVMIYLLSLTAFIAAAAQLRDPRWLRRLVCVYFGFAAVLIGARLMPELRDVGSWLLMPYSDGSLTWTWFAALAGAQALCNRRLNWRWRVLLALVVGGELIYAMSTNRTWLSGWMPPLAAIGIVVLLVFPRLGAGLAVAVIAATVFNLPGVIARLTAGDNLYSLSTRLEAWRILLRMSAINPILGLGPANYYELTPQFPIRGYHVHFSSHSTFVDLLLQTGIVGLACFFWLVWALVRAGWRVRARPSDGFTRAYAIGALGGLAGTIVAAALGDWVFPFVYNVTLGGLRASLPAWVLLGGLIALDRGPRPPHRARSRHP